MTLHRYLASASAPCSSCGSKIAAGADVWMDAGDLDARRLCLTCRDATPEQLELPMPRPAVA